jgi:hypothetical protein
LQKKQKSWTGQPEDSFGRKRKNGLCNKFSVSFRFFLSVVVHGTWFSRKRVKYVLLRKIMVQSYVDFSQAKYPKKGILLDERKTTHIMAP